MSSVKMTWASISEIVAGLLLKGELSPSSINTEDLIPPYDELHRLIKRRMFDEEKIIEKIGPPAFRAAQMAADAMGGMKSDWPKLLERAASRHEAGIVFSRIGTRLLQGEETDLGPVHKAVAALDRGRRLLTQASKITPSDTPFVRTGWPPIDDHLGGLPESELTTYAAPPGTGKTFGMLKIAAGFAKQKKRVAVFSLEMTSDKIVRRLFSMMIPKKVMDYIYINDDLMSSEEIAAVVSRSGDFEVVMVDFAELLLKGDSLQQEQSAANTYLNMAWTAKNLNIPALLLAQLNRNYQGGIPRLQDIRYSGMAEILSSVVLLGFNPSQIYSGISTQQTLPVVDGRGYIILGKSKHGYLHGGPGAIQIDWNGESGWGDTSNWFPLVGV